MHALLALMLVLNPGQVVHPADSTSGRSVGAPRWTAIGATVTPINDSQARFTATTPGTYLVIATAGEKADTSVMVVLATLEPIDWREAVAACGLLRILGMPCEKADSLARSLNQEIVASRPVGFDESLLRFGRLALLTLLGTGLWLGAARGRHERLTQ